MSSQPLNPRRPALGGLLAPTREDAQVAQDTVFEYSQKLSQQVIGLEKENVDLQDVKATLDRDNKLLAGRVSALEDENAKLRSAGLATFQERNISVNQAKEAMQQKHGESMLLRNEGAQLKQRLDALTIDNARERGIKEKLQVERTQLQRSVCALEASADSMHSEMTARAASEARATLARSDLERHLDHLAAEKARSDGLASSWHFEAAQLRQAQEELAGERSSNRQLGGQLEMAHREVARLRDGSHGLHEAVSALHVEAVEARQREEAVAQEPPKLLESLRREQHAAAALRQRMAELERVATEHHRARTAAEGENATLRGLLAGAKNEATLLADASGRAVSQACGAGRLADEHAAKLHGAERGLAAAAADGARLRAHSEAVEAENAEWQARAHRFEAETVMLRGQLRGLEVTTTGLHSQCADLTEQLRRLHHLRGEHCVLHEPPASSLRSSPQPPINSPAFHASAPPSHGVPRHVPPQRA